MAILLANASRLIVTLLAVTASACAGNDLPGPAASAGDEAPAEQGYRAKGAVLTETGANGKPRYEMQAGEIRQKTAGGAVALRDIRMAWRDSRRNPWVVTAMSGELPESAAIISLRGDVRLQGRPGKGRPDLVLRTATLEFDTVKQRARTPDRVSVQSGNRRLTATGMAVDLVKQQLRLQSEVHGRFTP